MGWEENVERGRRFLVVSLSPCASPPLGALSPCGTRTDTEPSDPPGWLVGPSWRGYGDAVGGDGRPARDDRRWTTGGRTEIMV